MSSSLFCELQIQFVHVLLWLFCDMLNLVAYLKSYFGKYRARVHGFNYFSRTSSHKMQENMDARIISYRYIRRDRALVMKFWT